MDLCTAERLGKFWVVALTDRIVIFTVCSCYLVSHAALCSSPGIEKCVRNITYIHVWELV